MAQGIQTYNEMLKLINDTWLIEDPGIVKLLCASVVAHRLPGDPVWIFIVAGSSGGKSELLDTLRNVKNIHSQDSLTPNTFISGQKKQDKETSLLFKLNNGILTIKDFTTILGMQKDARTEVMAQLRKIYDGDFTKTFGTGEEVRWIGKLGLIAGITTAVYTSGSEYASMGERFIMYKLILPDAVEMTRRAASNASNVNMAKRREDIRKLMAEYLDGLDYPDTRPPISPALQEELIQLANLATLARSAIERNWRSPKKEIVFKHDREMPGRFVSQLIALAGGFHVMNGMTGGDLPETDKHILYKIALDSIAQTRRIALQQLVKHEMVETTGLATELNYPTETVAVWLQDLNALGMIDRISRGKGFADRWKLKEPYRSLMSKFEGIPMLNNVLEDSDIQEAIGDDPSMGIKQMPAAVPPSPAAIQEALEIFGGELIDDAPPLPEELH